MRIAQLANFVSPTSGGMKTAINALGRGYAASGHERVLIIPGPRDAWTEDAGGLTVMLRAPQVPGGYRMVVEPWRIHDVLDKVAPHSVEVSDKATFVAGARWAREHGAGSVLFSHERLDAMLAPRFPWPRLVRTTVDYWHRRLSRVFDQVVVTSRFAAAEFVRLGGSAPVLIPLGVDLDTFRPAVATPHLAEGTLAPMGLAEGTLAPNEGHRSGAPAHPSGRLSIEKRPDLAVATAVELHRRGLPVRMDVYGDGPHREDLEALAAGAPVYFHGHVPGRDALAERLAAADVSISACPGETFGLSILEALACGTPVVTADEGGGHELLGDAGVGATANPAALADAVLQIAARPADERRRTARAQAERFPWQRTVDEMLALHARLA